MTKYFKAVLGILLCIILTPILLCSGAFVLAFIAFVSLAIMALVLLHCYVEIFKLV